MSSIPQNTIDIFVSTHLASFYQRRIAKLSTLKLKDVLKRKNPYLFRAVGIENVNELIAELLKAYMSSSDEGIFGDAFFEPLARDLANGHYAAGEGVDVIVETDTAFKAFAVKSGTAVFNVQSRKRQMDEFAKMRNRLYKVGKRFDPIVGYSYGKKSESAPGTNCFREIAGQRFWWELSGDQECYLKILRAIKSAPSKHKVEFYTEWEKALNRFALSFGINFCDEFGAIDWEKLLRFNSGMEFVKWIEPSSLINPKDGK